MPRTRITDQPAQGKDPMPTTAPHTTEAKADVETKSEIKPAALTPIKDIRWETEGVRCRNFNTGIDPKTGELGDAEKQYRYLASEPLLPFYIPLGWGEKMGAEQWVQRNNLAIIIKKGAMVKLPKSVAEQLMESLKKTQDALDPLVLDGDGRTRRLQSDIKEIHR